MENTQIPPTLEPTDLQSNFPANGGAVTRTRKSLQEKQEARKAQHRKKINARIEKSMRKHHHKLRQRMRVITAETLAADRSQRAHQRELKKAQKRRNEAQALADENNKILFRAFGLKTLQEQSTYVRLRGIWGPTSVQKLIDDQVITEAQREAALRSLNVN
jgi:hypothetical protein